MGTNPIDLHESVAGEEDPGASIDFTELPAAAGTQRGDPAASAPAGATTCPRCAGSGRLGATACPDCSGSGQLNTRIGAG